MNFGRKGISAAVQSIADAIWPRTCLVCGRDEHLTYPEVCDVCLGSLLPAEGRPTPKVLGRLDVAFAYEETLRMIIHRFKFEHGLALAVPLAEKLAERIERLEIRTDHAHLVPVPDHPTRRRERGYNPAEVLTQALGKRLNRPVRTEIVHRVHHGPHQSILTDSERLKMHTHTFKAEPPMPGEETTPLLLVDDVIHTSTTLRRCAGALKRAGWQQVDAIALSG